MRWKPRRWPRQRLGDSPRDREQRFTAADIGQWHKQWLGAVYEWAGEYRQVNISKGGFPFAMSPQIPRLMQAFERDVAGALHALCIRRSRKGAGCVGDYALRAGADTSIREGNGRVSRLLSTLMGCRQDCRCSILA